MKSFVWGVAVLSIVASSATAQQLSPNAGAFSGEGQLNDHDGNRGTWQASGALRQGKFSGSLSIQLGESPCLSHCSQAPPTWKMAFAS
jgi:hypothetical protein